MSTGFPDEPGSREPGLDRLISALTADGYPHELAGRDAALAAFRAARAQPRRRMSFDIRRGVSARLSAVAAALLIAFAGLTAAAYAKALPGPVQHIAYSVLSTFGVPDNQSGSARHSLPKPRSASSIPTHHQHVPASPSASASCPCPAPPSRRALRGSALAVSAARLRLPANGWDQFTGKLSYHGRPEAGVRIRLLERAAGTASWRQVGSGLTGGHGGVRVAVPHVTTNATFRLAGPEGVHSSSISVTVDPRVQLWRAPAQPGKDKLVAASHFGVPGDTVTLQELSGGSWQRVAAKALGTGHHASFVVAARQAAGHTFRAVLRATATHGAGVSQPVTEPPLSAQIGARAIVQHGLPTPALPTPGAPSPGLPHPGMPGQPSPGGGVRRGDDPSPSSPAPVIPGPVTPTPVIPGPIVPTPVAPGPIAPSP